jgi:hypothetical protein
MLQPPHKFVYMPFQCHNIHNKFNEIWPISAIFNMEKHTEHGYLINLLLFLKKRKKAKKCMDIPHVDDQSTLHS